MKFKKPAILVLLGLGLLAVLVAVNINYQQNDEYIHYKIVQNFISGRFALDDYLAPTFVMQGIIAAVFGLILGVAKLPVLTALFSLACALIFYSITENDRKPAVENLLIVLLLVFNPLYIYSTFGFMTEIYFLFFTLSAFLVFYKYQKTQSVRDLVLFNVLGIACFLVKQFGLTTLAASIPYFLAKKKFKEAFLQTIVTASTYLFYVALFPKTMQMKSISLSLENLRGIVPAFSVVFTVLLYLGLFTAPLIINLLLTASWTKRNFILFFIAVLAITFFSITNFKPGKISNTSVNTKGERLVKFTSATFPYLGNVFGREGFYPDNIEGTKYVYPGFFDLFKYMELLGWLCAVLLLAFMVIFPKQFSTFEFFYLFSGIGLLLVTPKIYDRYLITLVPALILMLIKASGSVGHKYVIVSVRIFLGTFVLFWAFLGYQFFSDFYHVNKYLYAKSTELVESKQINKNMIKADNSWNQTYPNPERKWIYYFEYFKESRAKDDSGIELVEKYEVKYPLNFYKEANIYLYKKTRP